MENDPKRLKVIATQAAQDIEAGHMVLIPMAQVKPISKLVNLINIAAGRQVAYPFTGKEDKATRDSTIQRARDYKIKCLVGTTKILSVGINIPRASMLYETVLSSNLPNAEQRFARVLTPMEGKPAPVIRFFLDNFKIRKNCMRNEFWNCLVPKYKPIISDKDMMMFKDYLKQDTQFEKIDL
jgi:superfamily II DNA or RNA helicase